jgi:hypothetical protein
MQHWRDVTGEGLQTGAAQGVGLPLGGPVVGGVRQHFSQEVGSHRIAIQQCLQ